LLASCGPPAPTAVRGTAQPQTSSPLPPGPTATVAARLKPTGSSPPVSLGGAYLIAFHACSAFTLDCNDSRNHRVYPAESSDGVTWNLVAGWRPLAGSVRDVIRRGDTVYVYTSPTPARPHLASGTEDAPVCISLRTANGQPADIRLIDVSLILGDQGRLLLFFLRGTLGSDPAMCAPGRATCTKRIGSATEVEGTDAAEFVLDDGDRLSLSIGAGTPIQSVSDPDLLTDGRDMLLLSSHGSWMTVWTSLDLRGTCRQMNVPPMGFLAAGSGGAGADYFDSSSSFWLCAHGHRQVEVVIRRAELQYPTRQFEEPDWAIILTGESLGLGQGVNVESPPSLSTSQRDKTSEVARDFRSLVRERATGFEPADISLEG
jgi:hypothetical protein